jgi:hypothetical protein
MYIIFRNVWESETGNKVKRDNLKHIHVQYRKLVTETSEIKESTLKINTVMEDIQMRQMQCYLYFYGIPEHYFYWWGLQIVSKKGLPGRHIEENKGGNSWY